MPDRVLCLVADLKSNNPKSASQWATTTTLAVVLCYRLHRSQVRERTGEILAGYDDGANSCLRPAPPRPVLRWFWRIGRRIYTEFLAGERAGYGEQIVPALATQLTRDYGHGFAEKSLRRMVQFAATFPDEPIVATLSRQLS